MHIQCPKCSAPMQAVHVETTQVDRCTSCEGLWFDALEDQDASTKAAVDLLDPMRAPLPAPEGRDAPAVHCPRCHTRMIRMLDRRTRSVWYESCPVCYGKFFDA